MSEIDAAPFNKQFSGANKCQLARKCNVALERYFRYFWHRNQEDFCKLFVGSCNTLLSSIPARSVAYQLE